MVHWVFLIPAFLGGFAACYVWLYLGGMYKRIMGAVENATKNIGL